MKNLLLFIGLLIVFVASIFFVSRRAGSTPISNPNKLQVVASFYPLYFFASQIGGEKAAITNITPAGAEPHDYELTTQDVARITMAKLLILNGAHLEPWQDKIEQNLQGKSVTVVVAGESVANQEVEEEGKWILDPHVWLSPTLAKEEVRKIADGFIKADPAKRSYYEENMQKLLVKLDQLDGAYRQGLSSCQKKDIVTSHAAFGYLAKTYGLNQVAISGLSPDQEPSAKDLANVAEFARKNGIHYIFFESLVSPRLSQTIASEIGAQTFVLDPIEGLSDNDITSGENYFTKMEQNLKNLRVALACQ